MKGQGEQYSSPNSSTGDFKAPSRQKVREYNPNHFNPSITLRYAENGRRYAKTLRQ